MLVSLRKCYRYVNYFSKTLSLLQYRLPQPVGCLCTLESLTNKKLPPSLPKENTVIFKDLEKLIIESRESQKLNTELLKTIIHNNRITPKQRLKLVNETFEAATKNIVKLEKEHFILKLKCYLKCRENVSPKVFFKEINEAGVEITEDILQLLLKVVCEHGDPGYVSQVISAFRSRNILPNDEMFSSLVISHAVKNDSRGVRQVIEDMKEVGLLPGSHTYTSLLRAAAMTGDYSSFLSTKAMAMDQQITMTSQQILSIVDTLVRNKKEHLVSSFVGDAILSPEEISNFLEELVFSGGGSGVLPVLRLLPNDLMLDAAKKLIDDMFAAEVPVNNVIGLGKKMVSEEVYSRALYDILEKTMLNGRFDAAVETLKACKETNVALRPHFFWPLIVSSHQKDADKGVYDILELMTSMGVKADLETLIDFVLPRITIDDSDAILKRLRDSTQLPLSQLLTPFLAHILKLGRVQQVLQLCKRYESSVEKTDLSVLNTSLVSGFKVSRDAATTVEVMHKLGIRMVGDWLAKVFSTKIWLPPNQCIELLSKMKELGLSITSMEERQLERLLQKGQCYNPEVLKALKELVADQPVGFSSSPILHPAEMNASQLECHIKELEGKGMNIRGALRKAIQQHCREGNVKEARQAFSRLQSLDTFLSPGILSAMLEINVKAGDPDEALIFLRDIEKDYPQFRLDSYKIVDLAKALVLKGRFEEALKLIKSRPQKQAPRDVYVKWERNCWELLTACAKLDATAVSKMLESLIQNRFCIPDTVILGPLVKVYIESGNLIEAVDFFLTCARKYKRTPQLQELLMATLSSNNPSLSESVIEAASDVKGESATKAVLIAALAIKDDEKSLRTVLQNAKLDGNFNRQLTRLRDLGQIEALKTVLTASYDLQHVDKDLLVSCILYHYQRTGNVEDAVQWWSELEEKGIHLSEQQKSAMAALIVTQKS